MGDVDEAELRALVDSIRDGSTTADEAVARLRRLPFADVGDALVDHHRALRQGMPEAVYAPGKTAEQCVRIVEELLEFGSGTVVLSRASPAQIDTVIRAFPGGIVGSSTVVWRPAPRRADHRVVVVTAGTSDLPIADECALTLCAHGYEAELITDVGVSGIHRLLAHVDRISAADAIVVVAGMEGALASVVGGLTAAPVVAVPTSVGYGASLEGVTALLSMLSSCASGLTVVGIDNGFGAACAVVRMMRARAEP